MGDVDPSQPRVPRPLEGRRVVLGVTGGIAAYKAVELCRRLVDAGAFVSPVLTEGALRFVGRTTFDALASEPARTSLFDDADPIPHTRLGQNADLVVVAPATARLLADYATGRSHDLLVATLVATRAPVVVAPAMHTEMWEHPAIQDNVATLAGRGVVIVPPEEGRLAGGDVGAGRLADPARIAQVVETVLAAGPHEVPGTTRGDPHEVPGTTRGDLAGLEVLVTAGGTRERIDAVRVVSNRSSGKQGYAVAAEAAARGARVTLVTTVDRAVPDGVAEVVRVDSAADMQAAVLPRAPRQDVIVMAAAVADFRPKAPADRKLKKHEGPPVIELEPTHDFLVDLGRDKPAGQVLVGFAAETDDVVPNARGKLERKGLDLIVANDVGAPGVGFEHDTNAVVLVFADRIDKDVPLSDKRAVARAVLDAVVDIRTNRSGPPAPLDLTSSEQAKETHP